MTVSGDVYFGRNITLRGTVISMFFFVLFSVEYLLILLFENEKKVVANEGQRIDIPDGCVLENSTFIFVLIYVRRLTIHSRIVDWLPHKHCMFYVLF